MRSTIEISDDFELPKLQLKKPLTTTKRGPSVKERLAQQKAARDKERQNTSSFWGLSSSDVVPQEDERETEKEPEEVEITYVEQNDHVPGARPTGPMGAVLDKVEQWIASRNNREHLPKNKAKLRSSIKPMCQVRAPGLDYLVATEKLKQEGYIEVTANAEKTVKYLRAREQESAKFQFRSAREDSAPKDPATEAMQRCKAWVVEPLNAPKTLDALQNCLKQLCTVKYEFDPYKVVKLLEEQRIITIDNNDKVHYC